MTVLIVGGSGFLGTELVHQANSAGHKTIATYATQPGPASPTAWRHLDLRDACSLDAVLSEARPQLILNASSGSAHWPTTAEGPIRLAIAAAKHGTRMVHVSSDAVFSGARVHYDESSLPDPITPYGAAKAASETGILAVHPKAAVARTSLIIGHGRSVHERAVHELAAGTRDGVLFTDDIRCPVHVTDLAAALLELADADVTGIHHLAGPDAVSRHVPCQVHLFRFCGVLWGPETQKSRPGVKVGRGGSVGGVVSGSAVGRGRRCPRREKARFRVPPFG